MKTKQNKNPRIRWPKKYINCGMKADEIYGGKKIENLYIIDIWEMI